MDDNRHITQYLDEYINMRNPRFAVMITGKWGCGKTYYIHKRLEEWNKITIKADKETIQLKPIYISVNGLSSVGAVVRKIKTALYPLLYSKGARIAKKVIMSALLALTKSKLDLDDDGSGEDLKSLMDVEGILEVFKSNSEQVKGNRILVIDDVERCRLPLDELFGFINEIIEHSDSKAILICDESRLLELSEKDSLKVGYKDFKEKVIGQTFTLTVDYPQMVNMFIDAENNQLLHANRQLITELFVSSKCENLRIILHCLRDIKRFFEQLPDGLEKHTEYDNFVKNVIAYLVITSIEERLGNKHIEYFQSYNFNENAKEANAALEGKYLKLLQLHQIYNSEYAIPVRFLLDFIRNGYISSPENLIANCRMLQSKNISDWQKLWNYTRLSNEEFCDVLNRTKDRFYNKKLDFVFEVAHLSGILLSLEREGLVKLSRKYIVRKAKENIRFIFSTYPDDIARLVINSQGYEFQERETDEMHEILTFARIAWEYKSKDAEKAYITNVWNTMGPNTTCSDLDVRFAKATPTNRCQYSMLAIFSHISPKEMTCKILSLPNSAKLEFLFFLSGRYYLKDSGISGQISEEMKSDKLVLETISQMLRKKSRNLKLVDKDMALRIANAMSEAVEKM